ncbi:MAG: hypothetical protein JOZ51_21890 [Chloroflexi bacterium]|nr:hypothetical protein [Chloroflexota bacterium]
MFASYRANDAEAELENMLRRADESMMRLLRGQAGRYPARRLPALLRQQGFLPTQHFLDRLRERAQARGIRFDPRLFGDEFQRARHYRQTRPGYTTRIAVMRGLPVLYRMGGRTGNKVVLAGVLPEGGLPPVVPASPPRLREGEELFGRLWNRLRAVGGTRRRPPMSGSAPRGGMRLAAGRGTGGGRMGSSPPSSGGMPPGGGGTPRLVGSDTLVVGRGRSSARSTVPDIGMPVTMDIRRATNPHYRVLLDQALAQHPELRGAFRDVFLERMGITPTIQAGTVAIGVTPAGAQVARDMLRQGGTLRVLQSVPAGATFQQVEQAIRRVLPAQGLVNIQAVLHQQNGLDHVLLTATRA